MMAIDVENESHRTNDGRMADMRAEDSNNNPLKDQTHQIMNLQNRHAFGAETTKSSIIKDEPSSSHFSFVEPNIKQTLSSHNLYLHIYHS
jgi:hypothetical protein